MRIGRRLQLIILASFLLVGIVLGTLFLIGELKSKNEEVETFRNDIVALAEGLSLEDWSEDEETPYTEVNGYLIMTDESEIIFMIGNEEVLYWLTIEFNNTEDPTKSQVWNVMITYINLDTKKELFLDYYIYDEFLRRDFDSDEFEYTRYGILDILEEMTVNDFEYILIELGFEDYL